MKTEPSRTGLPVIFAVAALTSAALGGSGCPESVIYDNGYPNGCNGLRSEIQPLNGTQFSARSADDFALDVATSIGGAHWYALETTDFTWSGQVVIEIYEPEADCPGTVPMFLPLVSRVVPDDEGTVSRTVVRSPGPFGLNRVRYDVSGLGVDLEAGTYFLAVMPVDLSGGAGETFWETARCGDNGDPIDGCEAAFRCAACNPSTPLWVIGSDFFGDVHDLAFILTRCLAGADCPADVVGPGGGPPDGVVDVNDLLAVLAQWGGSGTADITGPGGVPDGVVDVNDLLAVLGAWGPCPASDEGGADEREDALLVFEGAHAFDTTHASTDPDDPPFSCGTDVGNDVWFCYTAECTEPVTVSLCDPSTDFDTVLEVWDSPGGCGELGTLIACNDDGPDACGPASQVTFDAAEGERFTIRIGGVGGATGGGLMDIFCGPGLPNDSCDTAEPLEIDQTVVSDTTDTGISAPTVSPCPPQVAGGLWYQVVGDGTALTATTCGAATQFDTQLTVFCASCIDPGCIGSNDDDPLCIVNFVGESTVTWCSELGEPYLLLVHGATANDEGAFQLTVSSSGFPCGDPAPCSASCLAFPDGCELESPVLSCPVDGNDPGLDPNGGCSVEPPAFDTIAFGEQRCGKSATFTFDVDGTPEDFRDTDWYLFTVPSGGCVVTLACEAEFSALYGLVQGVSTCVGEQFVVFDITIGECEPDQSVSAFLPEGSYAAYCAYTAFAGLPCGADNDYTLTLTSDCP